MVNTLFCGKLDVTVSLGGTRFEGGTLGPAPQKLKELFQAKVPFNEELYEDGFHLMIGFIKTHVLFIC